MAVQFANTRAEYEHLANIATPINATESAHFHSAAHRIVRSKQRYLDIQNRTGVPALWVMVINERESGSDFRTYLGNGDPFTRVTTHVPKGRGPFKSWEDGAVDAITYDHAARPGPDGWSWPWFLYRSEAWNGFGPRFHGRRTGYLWAGTQNYSGGKYVADGVWDPEAYDTQLGVFGLARAILEIDPSLNFCESFHFTRSWGSLAIAHPDEQFNPVKDEKTLTGVRWIQDSLNKIQGSGLAVDGSYGRHTRAAVRQFQSTHDLWVDGQAGDKTCSAIDAELAKMPKSSARPKDAVTVEITRPFRPEPVTSPVAGQKPLAKGPRMELTNIVNLAGMVAPQFAPALSAVNPLLPVAINVLGEALGLNGPHTLETISTGAAERPADEIASAIRKAATDYAKHVTGAATSVGVTVGPTQPIPAAPATSPATPPAPVKRTGGEFISQAFAAGLHTITAIGGILLGSGLLDPSGPLSGMAKTNPWIGLLLTVGAPALNWLLIRASNSATEHALK